MMDEKIREDRASFRPIAVVEHHQIVHPNIGTHDLCIRLYDVWQPMVAETKSGLFSLEIDCVLEVNQRIARALGGEPSSFRNKEEWAKFRKFLVSMDYSTIEELIEADPSHSLSWIFSQLYWEHLTNFRFSTAWLFTNALRLQNGLEENRLVLDKLGPFLNSLSGSGPPVNDGQTFYPDDPFYSTISQ